MAEEHEQQDQIVELRAANIGRLLLQAQRAYTDRAVEKLRARGYADLSLSHISLLPYLAIEGARITAIAEWARMTKQAVGQLVKQLEQQGYLSRAPDPDDQRAVVIEFTEQGQRLMRDADAVRREIEAEYGELVGGADLGALRRALEKLVESA